MAIDEAAFLDPKREGNRCTMKIRGPFLFQARLEEGECERRYQKALWMQESQNKASTYSGIRQDYRVVFQSFQRLEFVIRMMVSLPLIMRQAFSVQYQADVCRILSSMKGGDSKK